MAGWQDILMQYPQFASLFDSPASPTPAPSPSGNAQGLYDTNVPGRWYRPTMMDQAPTGMDPAEYAAMNDQYIRSASYVPQYYQGQFNVPEPTYALLDETPGIPQGIPDLTLPGAGGSETPITDSLFGVRGYDSGGQEGVFTGEGSDRAGPERGDPGGLSAAGEMEGGFGSLGGMGLGIDAALGMSEGLGLAGSLAAGPLGGMVGGLLGNLGEARALSDAYGAFGVSPNYGSIALNGVSPFGMFGSSPMQGLTSQVATNLGVPNNLARAYVDMARNIDTRQGTPSDPNPNSRGTIQDRYGRDAGFGGDRDGRGGGMGPGGGPGGQSAGSDPMGPR